MSNLTSYELTIDLGGGTYVRVKPHVAGNQVYLTVDIATPLGPIRATLGMSLKTFDALTNLMRRHNVIPRLSDLLEGTFGQRPIIKR